MKTILLVLLAATLTGCVRWHFGAPSQKDETKAIIDPWFEP